MKTWHQLLLGTLFALLLLLGTGLVPRWGQWYSSWPAHRLQAEALMSGQLALSQAPTELDWDYTWSGGGVQQVWGLGVGLWRLPFVTLAKLFGFSSFPDHLAFGLFVLLIASLVLRTWGRLAERMTNQRESMLPVLLFIVLLGFPPFVSLVKSRFAIYEETIAYAYLFALLQATLLLSLILQPRRWLWWTLCGVAGLGGLIRPTLMFYGVASLLCGALVMVIHCKPARGQRLMALLWTHGLAVCLFCLGGGLLWLTNLARFGNGFEFGHQLNLQTYHGAMHATRFDHPFQDESLGSATRELFGALFLPKRFNGENFQTQDIFPGQSSALRWREFSFDTYHLGHLLLLFAGWGLAAAAFLRFWPKRSWSARANGPEGAEVLVDRVCAMLGLWSLIASMMLAVLYLRVPWMTSRYTLDFGAAFAVGITLIVLAAMHRARSFRAVLLITSVVFAAWVLDLATKRSLYNAPVSADHDSIFGSHTHEKVMGTKPSLGSMAALGTNVTGIPFDREGWDQTTGRLQSMCVLFVENPEFLELEIERRHNSAGAVAPEHFRAKIGLEHLTRESIVPTEKGWLIRFHGPQQRRYQNGTQTTFIATVPKAELTATETQWILTTARWRGPVKQDGSEISNP